MEERCVNTCTKEHILDLGTWWVSDQTEEDTDQPYLNREAGRIGDEGQTAGRESIAAKSLAMNRETVVTGGARGFQLEGTQRALGRSSIASERGAKMVEYVMKAFTMIYVTHSVPGSDPIQNRYGPCFL